jgi:hypothetical protein
MGFEKPPRLGGVQAPLALLADRRMGNGFKRGRGGGAFSQRGSSFRDYSAGLNENPECREMIVLAETGEIL